MPDVLIFLKLLRFALLEQFLDDACSIALPRYIMLTILSENWLLHFEKLESTFPMLLMEKVEYAKLYFILLTSHDDFVNILSTEKYVEYSERTLIERKWKEKNDSLAAHLIFRARGSDEHFLLTRTQLHTGEGEGTLVIFQVLRKHLVWH